MKIHLVLLVVSFCASSLQDEWDYAEEVPKPIIYSGSDYEFKTPKQIAPIEMNFSSFLNKYFPRGIKPGSLETKPGVRDIPPEIVEIEPKLEHFRPGSLETKPGVNFIPSGKYVIHQEFQPSRPGSLETKPRVSYIPPAISVIQSSNAPFAFDERIGEFCAGRRQSPINLQTTNENRVKEHFSFKNWNKDYKVVVENNAHTIVVRLANKHLTLTGGDLDGYKYIFDELHFHWGSEHLLNGTRQAMEHHFVFHNSKYKNYEEAIKYHDGIVVLAGLYRLSQEDNRNLEPILDHISELRNAGHHSTIKLNLGRLLPRNQVVYYRYFGSLTTGNCNEVVTWTVFEIRDKISFKQLQAFKSIRDFQGNEIKNNYRKVQPLNERTLRLFY